MQLSGELAKVNLANLLQLVKTGGLTGKITFSQGATVATVSIRGGLPIHAHVEGEEGVDGLMELFLWTSGSFSFNEEEVDDIVTIDDADPDLSFERLLKEGLSYREAKDYLDENSITPRTIMKPTGTAVSLAKQVLSAPGLERLDGKKTLAEALSDMHLSKKDYVRTVSSWLIDGLADVAEPVLLEEINHVDLPAWVISRLKQDNQDISQAIVDMVIWVDRVKCWMFQVDVDFYKIRKQLAESTGDATADDANLAEDYQNSIFAEPAPPPSDLSLFAPVNFGGPDLWRSTNYYHGGSLFKPSILDTLSHESELEQAQEEGTTNSGTYPSNTDKKDSTSDKQSNQSTLPSIEF